MANNCHIKTRLRCTRVVIPTLIFYLFSLNLRCTYSLSTLSANDFETRATQILERHNQFRKCHDAPPLKFDKELSKQAQNEAVALATHKILSTVDHNGNFYEFRTNRSLDDLASDHEASRWFSGPVDSWYDEINFYNDGYTPQTVHFTQLVWKNSKRLGVGIAQSDDDVIYIVCKYDPVGNVENSYDKNVFIDANIVNDSDICRFFVRSNKTKSGSSKSTPETDTSPEPTTVPWTGSILYPHTLSLSELRSSTESLASKKSTESHASSKSAESQASSKSTPRGHEDDFSPSSKSTSRGHEDEFSPSSKSGSSRTIEKSTTEGAEIGSKISSPADVAGLANKTSAGHERSSKVDTGSVKTSTTQLSGIASESGSVSFEKSTTEGVEIGSKHSPIMSADFTSKTSPGVKPSSEFGSKSTVSKGSTSSDTKDSMAEIVQSTRDASSTVDTFKPHSSPSSAVFSKRTSDVATSSTTETLPVIFIDTIPSEPEPTNNGSIVLMDELPHETELLKLALFLLGLLLVSLAVILSLLTLYMLFKMFFCCLKLRCGNRNQETNMSGTGGGVGGVGAVGIGASTITSPPSATTCVISMSPRPVSPPLSRPASPMYQGTSLTRLY